MFGIERETIGLAVLVLIVSVSGVELVRQWWIGALRDDEEVD